MPRVLFTGGGTAGHVTPNLALIEAALSRGWQCLYAGSTRGVEHGIISGTGIPFFGIASGKLRRYFSWQNFTDPFFVFLGFLQSLAICRREKPDVVFSKGGFVSVPVVAAAWLLRIPVVSHESDVTPGLANRLASPLCRKICVTFEATKSSLPLDKVVVTGTPLRKSLLDGHSRAGLEYLGFSGEKPVLLVFGGSLGARAINEQVRAVLDRLLATWDVIHVTGSGQCDDSFNRPGYVQQEFIREKFGDVLAAASLAVSRAGANSLYELLVTRTPHLLIPLPLEASRGDQLVNAETFVAAGYSRTIHEPLTSDAFLEALNSLNRERAERIARMETIEIRDSVGLILEELHQAASE